MSETFHTTRNKPFGFETLRNVMKNIHQNWEPDAFVRRLLSHPSRPAIPRPLLNEGEGRNHCTTPGFGVSLARQALSPTEALSASPTPQAVLRKPCSGQRRPPWALTTSLKCPIPAHCTRATGWLCHHEAEHCAWGPGLPRKHADISLQILPSNIFISPSHVFI